MKYIYETLKFFNNALIDDYKNDCHSSRIIIEDDSDNKLTYLSNSHLLAVIPTEYCTLKETITAFNKPLVSVYNNMKSNPTQACADNGIRKQVKGIKQDLIVIDCFDDETIYIDSKYYKLFSNQGLGMRASTEKKLPFIAFYNGDELVGFILGVKVK